MIIKNETGRCREHPHFDLIRKAGLEPGLKNNNNQTD
jgi:hypothetical protein